MKWIKATEKLPEDCWQGKWRDSKDNSLKEYQGIHELDKGRFLAGSFICASRFVEWLDESESIPSVKNTNTMYEVLAGNRVRKKLEGPEVKNNDYFLAYGPIKKWEEEQAKQPTYPISGSHNWKEGQLIELEKDFKFGYDFSEIDQQQAQELGNEKEKYKVAIPSVTNEEDELFEELPEPVGNFILEQKDLSHQPLITPNGNYYHYSDVCVLMKRYASRKPSSSSLHG